MNIREMLSLIGLVDDIVFEYMLKKFPKGTINDISLLAFLHEEKHIKKYISLFGRNLDCDFFCNVHNDVSVSSFCSDQRLKLFTDIIFTEKEDKEKFIGAVLNYYTVSDLSDNVVEFISDLIKQEVISIESICKKLNINSAIEFLIKLFEMNNIDKECVLYNINYKLSHYTRNDHVYVKQQEMFSKFVLENVNKQELIFTLVENAVQSKELNLFSEECLVYFLNNHPDIAKIESNDFFSILRQTNIYKVLDRIENVNLKSTSNDNIFVNTLKNMKGCFNDEFLNLMLTFKNKGGDFSAINGKQESNLTTLSKRNAIVVLYLLNNNLLNQKEIESICIKKDEVSEENKFALRILEEELIKYENNLLKINTASNSNGKTIRL